VLDFIPKNGDKKATPAHPPILGLPKTEFVINLKTAKALGLSGFLFSLPAPPDPELR
jgi:hypothetical protein